MGAGFKKKANGAPATLAAQTVVAYEAISVRVKDGDSCA
jgi:hypothetical protein